MTLCWLELPKSLEDLEVVVVEGDLPDTLLHLHPTELHPQEDPQEDIPVDPDQEVGVVESKSDSPNEPNKSLHSTSEVDHPEAPAEDIPQEAPAEDTPVDHPDQEVVVEVSKSDSHNDPKPLLNSILEVVVVDDLQEDPAEDTQAVDPAVDIPVDHPDPEVVVEESKSDNPNEPNKSLLSNSEVVVVDLEEVHPEDTHPVEAKEDTTKSNKLF
jgi:hypothetical protein